MAAVSSASGSESVEQVDLAKEFNLLPSMFDILQIMQEKNDAQEMTKKV